LQATSRDVVCLVLGTCLHLIHLLPRYIL